MYPSSGLIIVGCALGGCVGSGETIYRLPDVVPGAATATESAVYLADFSGARILAGPLSARGSLSEVAHDALHVDALLADATTLYFTTELAIRTAPLGGGPTETLVEDPNPCAPVLGDECPVQGISSFAIDSTHLYWTASAPSDGLVFRVPLGGGAVEQLASGQSDPREIFVQQGVLYWSNTSNLHFINTEERDASGVFSIMKMPVSGGPPVALLQREGMSLLAVDPHALYVFSSDEGALLRLGLDGGGVETIAEAKGLALAAVDASGIYWVRDRGGDCTPELLRTSLDGRSTTVMARGNIHSSSLATTSEEVVWVGREFSIEVELDLGGHAGRGFGSRYRADGRAAVQRIPKPMSDEPATRSRDAAG
jgi:hypothetical protein